jgi:hypothetical protein
MARDRSVVAGVRASERGNLAALTSFAVRGAS